MADHNIDDRELRDIFHDTAKDIFFHNDTTIDWNFAEDPRQLPWPVGHNANICAPAQIRHDTVGDGWLELRIDIAGNQCLCAFGKTHVQRREAVKRDSEHGKDGVDVLFHTAALGADRYALTSKIRDG